MTTLTIDIIQPLAAPADVAWQRFGEDFGGWHAWSGGIASAVLDGPVAVGVMRTTEAPGVGTLMQQLTQFSPEERALTYEVRDGMPAPIRASRSGWVIAPRAGGGSELRGHAAFELAWWARPLSAVLRKKMTLSLRTFASEFAAHVGGDA